MRVTRTATDGTQESWRAAYRLLPCHRLRRCRHWVLIATRADHGPLPLPFTHRRRNR